MVALIKINMKFWDLKKSVIFSLCVLYVVTGFTEGWQVS